MTAQFITSLETERKALLSRLTLIENLIASYRGDGNISFGMIEEKPVVQTETDKNYPLNANLQDKVFYALKKRNRFLHNREIAKEILLNEPSSTEKEIVTKLSPLLSRLKREGVLSNVKVDGNNLSVYWGSPKWLDDKGEIKSDYKYDSSFLEDNKSKFEI